MSATGLTDGVRYEITVYARNAAGRSAPTTVTGVAGAPKPTAWVAGDRLPILLPEAAVVAHGRLWVVAYESNANGLTPATAVATLDAGGIPRNWQVLAQEPPYAPVYAGSALGNAAWLLAVGGNCCGVGAAGSGEVRISALHPDGSGDVWSHAGGQFQPRATRAGVAFDRMHLYVIGGFWWSGGSYTGVGVRKIGSSLPKATERMT